MKSESEGLQIARRLLDELSRLRSTTGRVETRATLKPLGAEAYGRNGAPPPEKESADNARRQAAEAIAPLRAAYERPDLVPDRSLG
jgi:hypothetical protein